MCGIAGIYTPGHPVDPTLLDQMAERLVHRGPDGMGRFVDQDIGLVHTRLSIVDLAGGAQPLHGPAGRHVTVANGEIYNAPDLARVMAGQGVTLRSHSDCAVIPALAEHDLDGFLDQLRGMFALASFDRQARRLVLARDRIGIKPLYVCRLPNGVAFASEIKGLWPLIGDRAALNMAAAVGFLQQGFVAGRDTAVDGVERLMPGERLDVDAQGHIGQRKWWSLVDHVRAESSSVMDEATALARFDELLEGSMIEHRHADVPVGLFLSGGIDSSILAHKQSGQSDGRAWTVGFDSQSVHDERQAAEVVADDVGIPLTTLLLNPHQLQHRQPMALWAGDDLVGDPACLPTLELARSASQSHKVVLSGEGGDEVFAGYGRYRPMPPQRWLRALSRPGSGGFRTRGRLDRLPRQGLAEVLRQQDDHWRQVQATWWREGRGLDVMTRMQLVDMQGWLVEDLLTKLDRMLMAYGVEGRVPFLDHRMVLFGLSLPTALRRQGRLGKWLPRRWLAQRPASAQTRNVMARKKGFTVPVADWLRQVGARTLFHALSGQPVIDALVGRRALKSLIERAVRGDKAVVGAVMGLFQLALWHRIVFEQGFARPPDLVDPVAWLTE